VKYLVVRRMERSMLAADWRALLVYGVAAGCGFAVAENIMYVLTGGFATAVLRAFLSVPLHCTTGALIGLGVAKGRTEASRSKWYKGQSQYANHVCVLLCVNVSALLLPCCTLVVCCAYLMFLSLNFISTVMFVPWLVHWTYDFLLTIAQQPKTGDYAALAYLGAIGFYLAGLYVARREAVSMSILYPEAKDIHKMIFLNQVGILLLYYCTIVLFFIFPAYSSFLSLFFLMLLFYSISHLFWDQKAFPNGVTLPIMFASAVSRVGAAVEANICCQCLRKIIQSHYYSPQVAFG
jgi:RsiW-degrading membrane proteinase PrsW (M82 family)